MWTTLPTLEVHSAAQYPKMAGTVSAEGHIIAMQRSSWHSIVKSTICAVEDRCQHYLTAHIRWHISPSQMVIQCNRLGRSWRCRTGLSEHETARQIESTLVSMVKCDSLSSCCLLYVFLLKLKNVKEKTSPCLPLLSPLCSSEQLHCLFCRSRETINSWSRRGR